MVPEFDEIIKRIDELKNEISEHETKKYFDNLFFNSKSIGRGIEDVVEIQKIANELGIMSQTPKEN